MNIAATTNSTSVLFEQSYFNFFTRMTYLWANSTLFEPFSPNYDFDLWASNLALLWGTQPHDGKQLCQVVSKSSHARQLCFVLISIFHLQAWPCDFELQISVLCVQCCLIMETFQGSYSKISDHMVNWTYICAHTHVNKKTNRSPNIHLSTWWIFQY